MTVNAQKANAVLDNTGILYSNSKGEQLNIEASGPSPMDLLLMSVAGCSGLTFRSLLERDGFEPTKLELAVEGVKSENRPRKFTKIHIHYDIQCEGLTHQTTEKYLKITERVCPVVQSLAADCDLDYSLNQES